MNRIAVSVAIVSTMALVSGAALVAIHPPEEAPLAVASKPALSPAANAARQRMAEIVAAAAAKSAARTAKAVAKKQLIAQKQQRQATTILAQDN